MVDLLVIANGQVILIVLAVCILHKQCKLINTLFLMTP